MNRIQKLFAEADRPVLSVYFCAGHPTFDSTLYNRKNQMSPYQKRNVIFEGSTMAKTKCDFSFHLA